MLPIESRSFAFAILQVIHSRRLNGCNQSAGKGDFGANSHWRFHRNNRLAACDGASPAAGFGGCSESNTGVRKWRTNGKWPAGSATEPPFSAALHSNRATAGGPGRFAREMGE